MKPLILSILPRPPHPTRDGSSIRNFHLLAGLSRSFRVRALVLTAADGSAPGEYPDGVSTDEVPERPSRARRLAALTGSLFSGDAYPCRLYASRGLAERVSRSVAEEPPAWIVAHEYHVGPLALRRGAPSWIDFHNVDSEIWDAMARTSSSATLRFLAARQAPRIRDFERRLACAADGLSCVSAPDGEALARAGARADPLVLANGVDLDRYEFRASPSPENRLFFVGDLSWAPNADGLRWFQSRVWPLLCRRVPALRAEIVGRGAPASLRRQAPAGVEYAGEVTDTRSGWRRAAVSIVPLLAGGGTRLKILESAAVGVPVVSTAIGARGLELEPETEILVRDEPAAFADAVAALLADPDRRGRQAAAARARVERQYDWKAIGARFAGELDRRMASR